MGDEPNLNTKVIFLAKQNLISREIQDRAGDQLNEPVEPNKIRYSRIFKFYGEKILEREITIQLFDQSKIS